MTGSWAASQNNPDVFTNVHRAMVNMLLSCEKLTRVVRVGNFNLYSEKMPGQPAKPVRTESDLPELGVYPSGLNLNGSPSDGNHYTQLYTIAHRTGDTRVDKGHNQIKAAVVYAVNQMRQTQLGIPDTVMLVRCISYAEQVETDGQGVQTGWTGAATVEVRIRIADWEVAA